MKLFFNCVEASTGYTSPFWLVETGLPFCFSLSSRQAFKTMPVLPQQEKDRTSDVKIMYQIGTLPLPWLLGRGNDAKLPRAIACQQPKNWEANEEPFCGYNCVAAFSEADLTYRTDVLHQI